MSTAKGKSRIQITLSDTLIARLDDYCKRTGMTRSAFITYVIGSALDASEALLSSTAQAFATQALANVPDAPDAVPNESGTYVF